MIIDQNTKISKVIGQNERAIEAIASINKHFKKLQNPILRKVLASRVTVKDAAGIGGVSVDAFLQKLADIGMQVAFTEKNSDTTLPEIPKRKFELTPEWMVQLDVRPTIDSGADPFSEIMAVTKTLQKDQILEIINVFEPIPLMNVLENQGFESFTEVHTANEFHTYFKKTGKILKTESFKIGLPVFDDFDTKMVDFGSNLVEMDVRQLEMPEPMVTILNALTTLPENHALFVHHKKVPQFLLPELKTRNMTWLTKEMEDGYVQMLIWK